MVFGLVLSSNANDVTYISALHDQPYFIQAELQTKEKLSNRSRAQDRKKNTHSAFIFFHLSIQQKCLFSVYGENKQAVKDWVNLSCKHGSHNNKFKHPVGGWSVNYFEIGNTYYFLEYAMLDCIHIPISPDISSWNVDPWTPVKNRLKSSLFTLEVKISMEAPKYSFFLEFAYIYWCKFLYFP